MPDPSMDDPVELSLGTWRSAFHAMFESSPDGILIVDPAGRILATNTKACTMFGYPCGGMRGLDVEVLVPERMRDLHRALRAEYLRDPRPRQMNSTAGFTAQRRDGTTFPVEIGLGPMQTERGLFLHTIVRDITEQHAAEQALRESEERYRSLVELSPVAIVVHSEGRVRYVNRACLKLMRIDDPAKIIGMPQTDLVPPEYRAISLERRLRVERTNEPLEPLEMRVQRPDGEVLFLEANGAAITYEGKPASHVVVQDVTDRKRAELALRESRRQLRNLSTHLQNVREEERTRIAREIHDELGQDLTAIRMDIAQLEDAVHAIEGEADTAPLMHLVESITATLDTTIRSMRRIMTDLRPAVLDSLGLFAAVEWQSEEFHQRTRIPCTLHVHGEDSPLSREQATAVFRIFQESLTNIVRHAQAQSVEVDLICDHSNLVLVVHDDGCGLQEGDLAKSTSFGVLGMRERAHLLGGSVDIIGEPGKGTTVTVRIPFVVSRTDEEEA